MLPPTKRELLLNKEVAGFVPTTTVPFGYTCKPLVVVSEPASNGPAKVLVAVVLVALKYGALILPHASFPPANVEVATDLIQMGMVVVGVSAFTPKVSVDCCQS